MPLDATLKSLLGSKLQWIFIGGKGGVGKTTTSCSLATLFAATPLFDEATGATRPRRVLLISTDPAHNLSDAFSQRFGNTPTPVKGMEGTLSAMEIDPRQFTHGEFLSKFIANNSPSSASASSFSFSSSSSSSSPQGDGSGASPFAALGRILKEAAATLPGIDELSVFAEILRGVQEMSYDVVLFDTAPTGHTLRLLALPHTLNATMDKFSCVEGLAPLIKSATGLFSGGSGIDMEEMMAALARWRENVQIVQQQFTDPEKTAFVCVCIPEFLSVYETERLVQELMKYDISCDSIVVNQLVLRPSGEPPCRMCAARQKMQGKYLSQIESLYEDFHVVHMPLLSDEVRGVEALRRFAQFLLEPYDVDKHGYIDACST